MITMIRLRASLVVVLLIVSVALRAAPDEDGSAWRDYELRLAAGRKSVPAAASKPSGPDSRTRDAIAAAVTGDRATLQQIYYEALAAEQVSGDMRSLRQSDSILYLFNSTLTEREQFLTAQESAARQTTSDELRTRILLSLLDDEYYEINQLKGQNRFNRFTRVFNRASSSLSKLAMFQPQDAAQLLLDGAYSLRKARSATEKERRMVYLARAFLKKYPSAPEAPEVQELLRQLGAKMTADRAAREKLAGKLFLEKKSYVPARFHLETAAALDPSDTETSGMLVQARHALLADEASRERSLLVARDPAQFTSNAAAVGNAFRALLLCDAERLVRLAADAQQIGPTLEYCAAACDYARGRQSRAFERLVSVAKSYPDSAGGRAAIALLYDPDFNFEQGFAEAVSQMDEERRKYIMTGRRTSEENAYVYSSAAIQSAGQAMSGVPLLFLTDALVRGVAEQFKTQVATDCVVDAAARYIRRYPDSARSRELKTYIAGLSKRAGEYARAGEYLEQTAASDPTARAQARENLARQLYEQAKRADDLVDRHALLQRIASEYPDTKIAGSASEDLAKLPPDLAADSIVLTRKMLEQDVALGQALGLPAQWLDKQKSNGELATQGIAISPSKATYSYLLNGESQYRFAQVPNDGREHLLARARALHTTFAFETGGRETLQRRILPLEIQGGAGGDGVEISPHLIPYKNDAAREKYFE